MDKAVLNNVLDVYDASLEDPVYLELYCRYRCSDRKMATLLEELPSEQGDVIMDHIAATAELHRRLLELACTTPLKR